MFSCQEIANLKGSDILHISTLLLGLKTMHWEIDSEMQATGIRATVMLWLQSNAA